MIRSARNRQPLRLGAPGARPPSAIVHLITLVGVLALPVGGSAALVDATWTGGAATSSYANPANWDLGQTPVNGADTYNVFIPASVSVEFDVDGAHEVTDLTLGTGSTLSIAPGEALTVLDDARISGVVTTIGGTFAAPGPGAQFLNNGARLYVSGAGTISAGALSYTATLSDYRNNLTLLSANGAGSSLNLASVQTLASASYGYSSSSRWNYDVSATNGGVVDLSALQSIIGCRTDVGSEYLAWLRFRVESGGDILLPSLVQTTGRTYFQIDRDGYSLPALEQTGNTYFAIAAGRSVSVPELRTMSGSGSGINLGAGAVMTAPKLASASLSGGSVTLGAGATLSAGELLSLDGAAISIGADGVLSAPKLVSLTNSSYTARPNQTFTHGAISNINGSVLQAADGATWDLSGVTGYVNTLNDYRANRTLLSADGAGSVLDLSGVVSFASASYGYTTSLPWIYDVSATNGGVVDLSAVQSVTGCRTDVSSNRLAWLRFRVESGGRIDLSSVRSITGRTRFEVGADGVLDLGDIPITGTTYMSLNHANSRVNVHGSMYLEQTGQLSMAAGSALAVEGDFLFALTEESRLATTEGVLHLSGSGAQYLEAGGEDLGLGGSTSGNFGLGRLVIGQEGQPTTVMLLDLLNNGNRTGGAREALYLYGVGGLDGLEMATGSRLVLDGINVYTQQKNTQGQIEWVHLNTLFGPGVTEIAFAGGTVAVPEPSALVLLLVLGAMAFSVRRRR